MFMTTESWRTVPRAVEALLAGLGYWLATIPTVVMLSFVMAYALRAQQDRVLLEGLRTAGVVASAGGLIALGVSLEQLIIIEFTEPGNFFHLAVAQSLISCSMVMITIVTRHCFSRARILALALGT